MKDGKAWIGDQVFDEDAKRSGVISDVSDGVYLLWPLHGSGTWMSMNGDRLTVTVPREERDEW
ncbi:hypothetical protein ACFWHF_14400 [Streptomyces griseoincarnatus]